MPVRQSVTIALASILLLGAGCATTQVSNLSPEEASLSLSLSVGDEIVMRTTVLGLGGQLVNLLGGESVDRVISVTNASLPDAVGIDWSITEKVETEASRAAREAYDEQYAETPIGVEIPDSPSVYYEERVTSGSVSSSSMKGARKLLLPDMWPEGEAGNRSDVSLIWLSSDQYGDLVNTRKTELSLGLFDESLQQYENIGETVETYWDQVTSFVSQITGEDASTVAVEEVVSDDNVITIEAEGDWGTYTLMVDGVRTSVRTIEAKNNFGNYTILANESNPLILELSLTPLAEGSLEGLNPSNLAEGFSGYEISEINKTPAN